MSVEELPEAPQTNSPGEQLRQARKRAGVSLESIAERTLISLHKLRALEQDDFAGVGGRAYATGYTRAYARVIGIDAKDIVRDIDTVLGAERRESDAEAASHKSTTSPLAAVPWFYPILAAVLVVLLLIVVVLFTGDEPQPEATTSTVAEPAVRSAEPVVPQSVETKSSAAPTNNAAAVAEAADDDEVNMKASSQGSASNATDAVAEQSLQPAIEAREAPASGSVSDATAAGDAVGTNATADDPAPLATTLRQNAEREPTVRAEQGSVSNLDLPAPEWDSLRLTFNSECWLEVSDATGRTLVADLAQPGQAREISGIAPFSLVLGDATAAAEIAFNGEAVSFAPRPGRRVLRLTIGE